MAGSRWIYHRYLCNDCECPTDEMVDRHEVPDEIKCELCDGIAVRIPSGTILKGEIEEKTHGGRMTNGKLYRQHTGFKELAQQRAAEVRMKRARQNGNMEEAKDAAKEFTRLQNETKKELTK